jgi:hypothetical protein
MSRTDSFDDKKETAIGGRFTFNINKTIALEAATYFFPNKCFSCERTNGTLTEGLFGVKVGKRFEKWGIFGKARPGFASANRAEVEFVGNSPFNVEFHRATYFAFDLGGVVEFYPSKRIVTRFEAGDTMIHFRRRTSSFPFIDQTGNIVVVPFTQPARTTHNFQFTAGVGFRF